MRGEDLTSLKFNRLTVTNFYGWKGNRKMWNCICECGKTKIVSGSHLKGNMIRSCGCLQIEYAKKPKTKMGILNKIPEYHIWWEMKMRCNNENNKGYKNYGGRGIKVCDRWLDSFENFIEDIGFRPTETHSLDRFPNNDGNYEKTNCRWATVNQQLRNQRSNVWIEYDGKKMIQQDWVKYFNIKVELLMYHLGVRTMKEVDEYYKNKRHKLLVQ